MKYVLGFDIGGTKSAVLLARPGKENVEFLERKAIPTHGTWKEVLGCLADMGKAFLETHQISGEECCIGVSCGGPLDSGTRYRLSPIWNRVWAWSQDLRTMRTPVPWQNGGMGPAEAAAT